VGVRRCLVVAIAVAAEALLAAASAAVPAPSTPAIDQPLSYAPLPASTLVSHRDLQFEVAQVLRAGLRTTTLAYRSREGRPIPVAVITSSGGGPDARVAIQRLAAPAPGVDARVLQVTVLEHLYGLTMRQDPEGRFCLSDGDKPCDAAQTGRSHPEVLRDLSAARAQALASAGQSSAGAPWVSVWLSPSVDRGANPDQVSVRVALGQQPLSNTRVFFNRAPHSSCSAVSNAEGVATCVLVDQHGDDGDEANEGAVPVLVTFPGNVGSDQVLLPTTTILKATQ
jgi:hypothetical protein